MERGQTIILLGLLVTSVVLADAYTWTDENGVIHYSDKPNPGAKVIDLLESSPTTSRPVAQPRPPAQGRSDANDEAGVQRFTYESLAVTAPTAEETLWNIGGTLDVSLALTPGLQAGHQVKVYFDGAPQIVDGTEFKLEEVWRGVHNLQAEILDSSGTLMIRSQPSRFYVQQNSVIQGAR